MLIEVLSKEPSLVPRAAVGSLAFYREGFLLEYNRKKEWDQLRFGYEEHQTAEEWSMNYDKEANEEDQWKVWEIAESRERREETLRIKRINWAKHQWDSMGDNTRSRAESDKEEEDIWSGNEEEQDELHDDSYTAASRKDRNSKDRADDETTVENKG